MISLLCLGGLFTSSSVFGFGSQDQLQFFNPEAHRAVQEERGVSVPSGSIFNTTSSSSNEDVYLGVFCAHDGANFCGINMEKSSSTLMVCECKDVPTDDKSKGGYTHASAYDTIEYVQDLNKPHTLRSFTVNANAGTNDEVKLVFSDMVNGTFKLNGYVPCGESDFCRVQCTKKGQCGFNDFFKFNAFEAGEIFSVTYGVKDSTRFKKMAFEIDTEDGSLRVKNLPDGELINDISEIRSDFQVDKSYFDSIKNVLSGGVFTAFTDYHIAHTPDDFNRWPGTGYDKESLESQLQERQVINLGSGAIGDGQIDLSGLGLDITNIEANESDGGYAINSLLRRAVDLMVYFAAALTVLFLVWGGLLLLTSGADSGRRDVAMNTIYGALAALFLISLSHIIVHVLMSIVYSQF